MHDPLSLLMPDRPEPVMTPEKTALLIVDLNGKDAHPDLGIATFFRESGIDGGEYYDRIRRILPKVNELRKACRDKGIQVIHTRVAARTADCRDMNRSKRLAGRPFGWSPIHSPESAFLKGVEPQENEIVIDKTSTSVFTSTAIDQLLRNMGTDCLIGAGGMTDACLGYSVRDAADRGYRVILVSDCTAAFTQQIHERALEHLDKGMIWVKTLHETLDMVGHSGRL